MSKLIYLMTVAKKYSLVVKLHVLCPILFLLLLISGNIRNQICVISGQKGRKARQLHRRNERWESIEGWQKNFTQRWRSKACKSQNVVSSLQREYFQVKWPWSFEKIGTGLTFGARYYKNIERLARGFIVFSWEENIECIHCLKHSQSWWYTVQTQS